MKLLILLFLVLFEASAIPLFEKCYQEMEKIRSCFSKNHLSWKGLAEAKNSAERDSAFEMFSKCAKETQFKCESTEYSFSLANEMFGLLKEFSSIPNCLKHDTLRDAKMNCMFEETCSAQYTNCLIEQIEGNRNCSKEDLSQFKTFMPRVRKVCLMEKQNSKIWSTMRQSSLPEFN